MKLLGLRFQLGKSALCVDVDRIFGIVANVPTLFELLRRPREALAHPFQTHDVFRLCPKSLTMPQSQWPATGIVEIPSDCGKVRPVFDLKLQGTIFNGMVRLGRGVSSL